MVKISILLIGTICGTLSIHLHRLYRENLYYFLLTGTESSVVSYPVD